MPVSDTAAPRVIVSPAATAREGSILAAAKIAAAAAVAIRAARRGHALRLVPFVIMAFSPSGTGGRRRACAPTSRCAVARTSAFRAQSPGAPEELARSHARGHRTMASDQAGARTY